MKDVSVNIKTTHCPLVWTWNGRKGYFNTSNILKMLSDSSTSSIDTIVDNYMFSNTRFIPVVINLFYNLYKNDNPTKINRLCNEME
jgi:hypothetical protein